MKDQGLVVGRHRNTLRESQAMGRPRLDDGLEVTHPPVRIALAKVGVERGVARGGVRAADAERPIEHQRRGARGAGRPPA